MAKLILGITGEMCSGKGTVAKYLVEKFDGNSHRFSTILRDILDRVHLDQNRENIQTLSMILRKYFSQDIMAKSMSHDVSEDNYEIVVVDGIRRIDDIKYLKELPHFRFIYVDADMQIRYERLTSRRENTDDGTKTFEQFQKEHEADSELQIKGLRDSADFVVDNNGTIEQLHSQIDKIISENI